jgi:hypothetical protein
MIKLSKDKTTANNWRKQTPLQLLAWGVGILLLLSVLIFLLFPDPFISSFLKNRITKAFASSYPADSLRINNLHYSFWTNTLACDSVSMKSNEYDCQVGRTSISGISWMKILWNKDITIDNFKNSVINTQKTTLIFRQSQNELCFEKLQLSIRESELVADSIKYYSLINDDKFFAKSKFRQTRFRTNISSLEITGLDFLSILQSNIYNAKCINIRGFFTDILVNMDKPYDKNSSKPLMPNEFLASIKERIKIDSVKIFKGRLSYSEQYEAKGKPGVITFNNITVSAGKISNDTIHPDTTIVIGEGEFLNSGNMKLLMRIPLTAKTLSLHYSGSLTSMEASKLNSFIEAGEHHRIKSGIINSAKFNINVVSGHASGELYAVYNDLSIVVLNNITGSENGIIDRVSSLFGKMFVIRGSNLPDKQGNMKIGAIKYSRASDDYFMQFLWFGLRNGLADVVGFPPK